MPARVTPPSQSEADLQHKDVQSVPVPIPSEKENLYIDTQELLAELSYCEHITF